MDNLIWPAPAKLNLFLHITGRRADGYHNLQTVFQFLDYADELEFTVNREDSTIQLNPEFPDIPHEKNLVVRAARLLQEKTGTSLGANIYLHKRLPMGGGIGGGSSDAATTLVALNQLWDLNLPTEELQKLGLSLGADVPIFIHGKASWAEGVGELFQPINLPEPWFVVLTPPCHVNTAEIFSDQQLTRDTPPLKIEDFQNGHGRNDFEKVVCQRHPPIARALTWLNQFAPARLTGSGACVFAAFADEQQARRVVQELPSPFRGFVAKGLNLSPLYMSKFWGVAKR
jgi:4-diphosphocytidyl-2-C-methyl-D-erythritol kinase